VLVRGTDPFCEPRCPEWISAIGEITPSTPAVFRKVLGKLGDKKLPLVITSPGGSIEGAIEIGNMVRKKGLTVAVGYTWFSGCKPDDKTCKLPKDNNGRYEGFVELSSGFCNSACPLILSGGVLREASDLSFVGLHEIRQDRTQEVVRYREYYKIVKGRKVVTNRKTLSRKTVNLKPVFGINKTMRKKLTRFYSKMGVDPLIIDEMARTKYSTVTNLPPTLRDQFKLRNQTSTILTTLSPTLCKGKPETEHCIFNPKKKAAIVATPKATPVPIKNESHTRRLSLMRPVVVTSEDPACAPRCPSWIFAEGDITGTSEVLFAEIFDAYPNKSFPVILNVKGGDARVAMALGKEFAKRRIDVALGSVEFSHCAPWQDCANGRSITVPFKGRITNLSQCRGPCALMLAGGHRRISAASTGIELPDLSVLKGLDGKPVSIEELRSYFTALNLNQAAVTMIANLRPGAVATLFATQQSNIELINSGLIPTDLQKLTLCKDNPAAQRCLELK
jgi:hypothetical protein